MTSVQIPQYDEITNLERIYDSYSSGDEDGPLGLCIAGLHGNEPSGIFAMKRVFEKLRRDEISMKGKFVGIIGNLPALDANLRFIDEDLNRLFSERRIKSLETKVNLTVEEQEMKEVLQATEQQIKDHEEVFYIDCHTTSSPSVPYISVNEYKPSLELVHPYPLFKVIGLEESIPGCMAEHFSRKGYHGFTIEAGQHHTIASVENSEASIWLFLVNSGLISREDLDTYQGHYDLLDNRASEKRANYKVVEHYQIKENEQFVMEPGYVNFQEISAGEVLAKNQNGIIRSQHDGRILMPLYQPQGDDGYFVLKKYAS